MSCGIHFLVWANYLLQIRGLNDIGPRERKVILVIKCTQCVQDVWKRDNAKWFHVETNGVPGNVRH